MEFAGLNQLRLISVFTEFAILYFLLCNWIIYSFYLQLIIVIVEILLAIIADYYCYC